MGEWSKRIGEFGEAVVGEFLELIGWSDSQRNLQMPCVKAQKHGTEGNLRNSHGIDFLFSYESQLFHRTLDHLIISAKFTAISYPANPSGKFKEYFIDLVKTIECFRNSEFRQNANRQFSSVGTARDIGVLFWLSNSPSEHDDIIKSVANSRKLDEYNYDSVFLVDNNRISFIYDTIMYLKTKRTNSEIEFFYPNTGRNYNPGIREASGKVLPVEYVNSSILPLKLINTDGSKTFVISMIDPFHMDRLKRLLSLSYMITSDFQYDTLILFPNYNQLVHKNDVQSAKVGFKDKKFTENVVVDAFRNDFRSLGNE